METILRTLSGAKGYASLIFLCANIPKYSMLVFLSLVPF